jgi:hypothetical protein
MLSVSAKMNTGSYILVRASAILGVLLLCYLVSFWIFLRAHEVTGRLSPGAVTTSFLVVRDTPANRFAVTFYTPALSMRLFSFPVQWE